MQCCYIDGCAEAVSYTHLDVYKRQVYYSIIDNFPKGVKEMEFENRDICCILKFYNRSSDSVYIPCNGLSLSLIHI